MSDDQRFNNAIAEYYYMFNDPQAHWPMLEFNRVAYARSAVSQLELYIMGHPEMSIIQAVESFKGIVGEWMCLQTKYNDANFITETNCFEVAYEVACDISDILGGMI